MNSLGNYPIKHRSSGSVEIEPTIFVATNWPEVCRIAGLQPVPPLIVIAGLPPDSITKHDTAAMFIDPDDGSVCVNKTDLETDAFSIQLSGGNPIGLLWALQGTMIRALLIRKDEIPESQRLGKEVAIKASWPPQLMEILDSTLIHDHPTARVIRVDLFMVQCAIQVYIQQLKLEQQIDEVRLKHIIRSQKDEVDLSLFRIN